MTHNWHAQLPDDNALRRGLSSLKNQTILGQELSRVFIVRREFNEASSTYPSEIVNCETDDGRRLHLYCKYSNTDHSDGHRRGIIHESRVYGEVLQNFDSTTPAYYGIFNDANSQYKCLVLEYVENTVGISRANNGLLNAARWLGRFHKEGAAFQNAPLFLESYNKPSYQKWSRRTASFASQSSAYDWIISLTNGYEENIDSLLTTEPTIIHGEFYPSNALAKGKTIHPVDWESAAIAAGELDLAALIEGWPPSITELCISEYLSSRWPGGAPPAIRKNIDIARIYWHLRWLGESPAWTNGKKRRWRVAELRSDGERLGLL